MAPQPSKFTSCPELIAAPYTPLRYLINELIPRSTLVLMHGDPRTRKSYTALELAICCASGLPAFGFERFKSEHSRVLYLSQEDPEHIVRERIRGIINDKEIDPPPNLFLGIHRNINLDQDAPKRYLYDQVKSEGYDLIFIDPIRRFTANADKGPSEVTPVTTYLRRFSVELNASIGILHHNTKPILTHGASRKDSYNASGGDWFASCECPISFHSNGDSWTHVIPQDYKLSSNPDPFDVQVTKDPETGRVYLRGRDVGEDDRIELLTAFLAKNPNSSENLIAQGCKLRRSSVHDFLLQCEAKGITAQQLGAKGSHLWSLS